MTSSRTTELRAVMERLRQAERRSRLNDRAARMPFGLVELFMDVEEKFTGWDLFGLDKPEAPTDGLLSSAREVEQFFQDGGFLARAVPFGGNGPRLEKIPPAQPKPPTFWDNVLGVAKDVVQEVAREVRRRNTNRPSRRTSTRSPRREVA